MNIMYDLTKYSNSGAKPDWRHAETFENSLLVVYNYMHALWTRITAKKPGVSCRLREVWLLE